MVNSLIYDEFLDVLSKYNGKIKYILNIKNGVIKKFNIDFKDLATVLQNEEIRHCWIAGYGVNENRYLG